ncbi:MAG: hypothetical protein ACRCZD_08390, partial [Phycicoccus sp.]
MSSPYAVGQLARALRTAGTHEDAGTRRRADARVRAWVDVLDGMSTGAVTVGARAPVRGLPAWVTLEVVRGGFATGRALAGGALEEDELDRVARLRLARSREALFASYLTDTGLGELERLLDDRAYSVRLPEDAALLVVAALVRGGHRLPALELLEELRPFASSLRFMPRAGTPSTQSPDHVHRRTVEDVVASLREIRPDPRVEAQREALSIWLPLTDRVVRFWQARELTGPPLGWAPGDLDEARALVESYDAALVAHPRCRKYRDPKENLPILVAALRAAADGRLDERWLGRVRHVVACVVGRRGTPDGRTTREVRAAQDRVAALPSHARLADLVAARLGALR